MNENDPLIFGPTLEQAGALESEDGGVHRLPRDLRDARELRGRELGPGLEHAEDDVLLRGESEVPQGVVEGGAESLVGESEEVAQVRVGFGMTCQRV